MRILHICLACIYTDGFNYQENLLSKYHAENNETFLIANQYMYSKGNIVKSLDKEYTNCDNVKVTRIEEIFTKLPYKLNFYIGIYKELYRKIVEIAPDIIFIHNIQFNSIRSIAKYAIHNPNVVIYADNHADFSNSGTNILSRFLLKTEWRRCAQLINPYVKKFYGVLPARVDFLTDIFHLPKEKCELLVMGADDELVKNADKHSCEKVRDKYGISKDDFLIITGGKIDLAKIQTINLIEAVKKLENPKVKLIVFGSVIAELREKVNALIDGKSIFYEEWLTGEESYRYLGAADLAVFPGRHSVYWEQVVGQGIPIVCKYWEGTTHIDCGGNAMFLHESSVQEIEKLINDLVNDSKKYIDMKRVAIEKGRIKFSYRNIAQKAIESDYY